MSALINAYMASIQSEFNTQQSTEHSFRSALKTLLESLNPKILALNESQRITGVGMPDFTIKDSKNNTINIGRIEAKDLYVDLDEKKNADQLGRYLGAFDNFIYTNNLTFQFYRHGRKVDTVSLGTCDRKNITWTTSDLFADNSIKLERLLIDFLSYSGQTITSSEKLAHAMAQKAQLIKYVIQRIFQEDGAQAGLYSQYLTFKDMLIADLSEDQFADMYAQTIAYGLFAARLHDSSLENFSRHEAEGLIPKSTPFVRWLFRQMANDDEFDDRVAHIIDDLVNIFLHADVATILHSYNKETGRDDPIIHFYETFLGEYDSSMRKKRGVYYTPEAVVKFIVRGVDNLLKSEFGLSKGLADTSKIEHTFLEQGKKIKKQVHRVQVLDPATGTGTFLDEAVKYIHDTYFSGQTGIWQGYVTQDLLPRIRGFEILMASYTMAHLKLAITLENFGITESDQRLNIYLTNSLEEPHDHIGSLFSAQLAKESEQASKIKKEQPIMIVMGNPPYAVSSSNKGEWIQGLIADYKKDLNEKKINLDDDYIKFLRYAQHFVDKNQEGIVGFITNNSYIDGITHRQMRKTLMESFDTIYIYDLHGNSKKKEVSPDGSKDENVFDIMQGVSIIFGVKTSTSKKLATVYHHDLRGKRDSKYARLETDAMSTISWTKLKPVEPYYFFVPKDFSAKKKYDEGIKLDKLFDIYNSGVKTDRDELFIDNNKNELKNRIIDLLGGSFSHQFKEKFRIVDSGSYKITKKIIGKNFINDYLIPIQYRPFDIKVIYYDYNLISRPGYKIGKHILGNKNICLILAKQLAEEKEYDQVFVSNSIVDIRITLSNKGSGYCFPLYLYNTASDGGSGLRTSDGEEGSRIPNLDMNIVDTICKDLGLTFGFFPDSETEKAKKAGAMEAIEHHRENNLVGPEDIFDYIYALLHSPTYRDTYKEFLKIDFPRVPFTKDREVFWKLVEKGRELRLRHLMEHPQSDDLITTYPISGDNMVEKIRFELSIEDGLLRASQGQGKVYINATQYIDHVPQVAREFYIGGYQPAQKWLKDRKGKVISYEDIMHYQKIIVALSNTARVMGEIDELKWKL